MKRPSFAMTHAVRDTCLCLHAQRAARVLARRFDDALRPVGLTNGQFSLIMSLNRPVPAPRVLARGFADLRIDRALVLALNGKTERGVEATLRVLGGRVARQLDGMPEAVRVRDGRERPTVGAVHAAGDDA